MLNATIDFPAKPKIPTKNRRWTTLTNAIAAEDALHDAVYKFNLNPNSGIDALCNVFQRAKTPKNVTRIIHSARGLIGEKVGEFLSKSGNEKFAIAFFDSMRMNPSSIVSSIRIAISGAMNFPKDPELIDRLISCFAKSYYHKFFLNNNMNNNMNNNLNGNKNNQYDSNDIQNININSCKNVLKEEGTINNSNFNSEETVYMLSFAIILLNSDLHNPKVVKHMTLKQFIINTKNSPILENISTDMLTEIYHDIKNRPLSFKENNFYDTIMAYSSPTMKGPLQMRKKRWPFTWSMKYFVLATSCLYYFNEKIVSISSNSSSSFSSHSSFSSYSSTSNFFSSNSLSGGYEDSGDCVDKPDGMIQLVDVKAYIKAENQSKIMIEPIERGGKIQGVKFGSSKKRPAKAVMICGKIELRAKNSEMALKWLMRIRRSIVMNGRNHSSYPFDFDSKESCMIKKDKSIINKNDSEINDTNEISNGNNKSNIVNNNNNNNSNNSNKDNDNEKNIEKNIENSNVKSNYKIKVKKYSNENKDENIVGDDLKKKKKKRNERNVCGENGKPKDKYDAPISSNTFEPTTNNSDEEAASG